MTDHINPNHYKTNSIEAIDLCELLGYCLGNAVKYIWRAGQKPFEGSLVKGAEVDLNKAYWYINRLGDRAVYVDNVENLEALLQEIELDDELREKLVFALVGHFVFNTVDKITLNTLMEDFKCKCLMES